MYNSLEFTYLCYLFLDSIVRQILSQSPSPCSIAKMSEWFLNFLEQCSIALGLFYHYEVLVHRTLTFHLSLSALWNNSFNITSFCLFQTFRILGSGINIFGAGPGVSISVLWLLATLVKLLWTIILPLLFMLQKSYILVYKLKGIDKSCSTI